MLKVVIFYHLWENVGTNMVKNVIIPLLNFDRCYTKKSYTKTSEVTDDLVGNNIELEIT